MINAWFQHGILLAQNSRLDSMRQRFEGHRIGSNDIVKGLLLLIALTALILLLTYVLNLQESRRKYSSPLRLFLALCKAHGLRWSECWLLWRVARSQRLRDPTRLFLEPERFAPAQLGPRFRMRAGRLKLLYERLYVGLAEGNKRTDEDRSDVQDTPAATPTTAMPVATTPTVAAPVAAASGDEDHPFPASLLQGK
ncbi:MAG: hypothetical protein HQ567_20745 [Candidatus Nealsonbacteria bacterium]|nr:hypothetical protein [Candidatus Nealsonbacteria bacterium]